MIKAFLFDYDGVITPGADGALPAKLLAKNVGISVDSATELIKAIWPSYSEGTITADEVWEYFEAKLGISIADDNRNIWYSWNELTPLADMIAFVKELRNSGYQVGLISDVIYDTADIIRQNGGYDEFDFLILSCEVGARKPSTEIYNAALAKMPGIKPAEVIYLDDRESLTNAASLLGLHSICVTNHQEAITKARELIENQAQ